MKFISNKFSKEIFQKVNFFNLKYLNKKLKIAIIGSRGYPYVYSGYETLVKELSERLLKETIMSEFIVIVHYLIKNQIC